MRVAQSGGLPSRGLVQVRKQRGVLSDGTCSYPFGCLVREDSERSVAGLVRALIEDLVPDLGLIWDRCLCVGKLGGRVASFSDSMSPKGLVRCPSRGLVGRGDH